MDDRYVERYKSKGSHDYSPDKRIWIVDTYHKYKDTHKQSEIAIELSISPVLLCQMKKRKWFLELTQTRYGAPQVISMFNQQLNEWNQLSDQMKRQLNHKDLTAKEEKRMFAENDEDGLIKHHFRFVASIARTFTGRGVSYEDLIAEGLAAILPVMRKHDPKRSRLMTHSRRYIESAMKKLVSDNGPIQFKEYENTYVNQLRFLADDLKKTLRREPTRADIGRDPRFAKIQKVSRLSSAHLLNLWAASQYTQTSLNQYVDGEDGDSVELIDIIPADLNVSSFLIEEMESADKMSYYLSPLNDRERLVLTNRHLLGVTRKRISVILGVSISTVDRIDRTAQAKVMKHILNDEFLRRQAKAHGIDVEKYRK